jgi:hypothetical protein
MARLCRESFKRGDRPEYPLSRVRELASEGSLSIEPRALRTAIGILPYAPPRPGPAARGEIAYILRDLTDAEFEYRQCVPGRTPADVYRVNWEEIDLYVKLKIEARIDEPGEVVAVISFKPWTEEDDSG